MTLRDRGNHQSFGVPVDTSDDKKKIDIPFLDRYASRQFEAILHFLVGQSSEVQPSGGVIHLLLTSKLMEKYGAPYMMGMELKFAPRHLGTPKITNNGFSFLLQEGNSQIWALLIQYLEIAEEVASILLISNAFLTYHTVQLGQNRSLTLFPNAWES